MAPKVCQMETKVDVDLHTQQVTFLPTSTQGLSIPLVLLFTKDQNTRVEINDDCNRKVKAESKVEV